MNSGIIFSQTKYHQEIINTIITPTDGKHQPYHIDGSHYEFEILNTKVNGIVLYYNADNILEFKYNFSNGKLDGKAYSYDENGLIYTDRTYSNDSLVFERCVFYYKNSTLIEEEWIWELNEFQIKRIPNRHLSKIQKFIDNKTDILTLYGTRFKYHLNGKLKSSEPYYKKKKKGICKYYSVDVVMIEEKCIRGKKVRLKK